MRNQKSFIFVLTLIVLLIGLTAISATDNNITNSVVSDNAVSTHSGNTNKVVSDTKGVSDNIKINSTTGKVSNNEKEITGDTKKVATGLIR